MITLKDVNLMINKTPILNNINLEFQEGKIYGLIGRNGSGKSMIIKIICGFIKPNYGTVLVDNIDIYKENSFPNDTRAFIDTNAFFPDLTGMENLRLLLKIQNKVSEGAIIPLCEKLSLIPYINKKYKTYSYGTKQKLGIIQVLMENPKIMIFDEPFNGVEEASIEKIREILKQKKDEGHIIIIATHLKEDIDNLCDVIYKIDNGLIVNSNAEH